MRLLAVGSPGARTRIAGVGQNLDLRSPVVVPPVVLDDGQPVGSTQLEHPPPTDSQDLGCFAFGDQ